jgi:erythronate-4-phosphate dehydrogenase
MQLVVDENISFGEEAFSTFGKVILCGGRNISNQILRDADALIVRSITEVNKNLLKNTKVRFVGTATIGTDHVDKIYLKKNNIVFASAAGCNSEAVAEYVFTVLSKIVLKNNLRFDRLKIGIVGVGNIGSKVARLSSLLGIKILKNDPPLRRKSHNQTYLPLDELMDCDILTFHVPLNIGGIDNTFHLFGNEELQKLKDKAILLNTSRGPVVNNSVLLECINEKNLRAVLDVWENEPDVNVDLLNKVYLATPHIAGYTLEGKVNGTVLIYNELCRYLKTESAWKPILPEINDKVIEIKKHESTEDLLFQITQKIYDIEADNENMRKITSKREIEKENYFDSLRKNYILRREFSNYAISLEEKNSETVNMLKQIGFKVI